MVYHAMSEDFDITLEFERITQTLEEMAHFSELAEDTLRLLIVIAQENNRLRGQDDG
jgi:hypothetical protein